MRQLMLFSFMLSVFGASVWQLTAGLVAEDYHTAESGIGYLIASFGVGASLCGPLLVRARPSVSPVADDVDSASPCYGLGALIAGDHPVHRGRPDRVRGDGRGAQPRWRGLDVDLADARCPKTSVGRVLALFIMSSFVGIPLGFDRGWPARRRRSGCGPTLARYGAGARAVRRSTASSASTALRIFDKG